MDPVAYVQFRVDGRDMVLDRLLGKEEPFGDFAIVEALGHQAQHFPLPPAERFHPFGGVAFVPGF